MRSRIVLLLVVGLACESSEAVGPVDAHASAIAYLDSAINIMKNRAFYRRRVNWDLVRDVSHSWAASATTTAATYPGDSHGAPSARR